MSNASLTARYRPQTFTEVAGQETVKTILSRASQEGKIAPAYLFSGTRGVGKTTLARVFAKALNCRTAPTAEPCNICDQCRAVTQGNSVDVVEIDGASNRGIDDVRRLKEVVGYAPMEGRYKIFIIDEAHMLSREAFNALLKTLEEPPARVTFIMATTEPHKFPATIISRCQHYVFKRLPENGLVAHLSSVLEREQIDFDETAVRLIARRGAGSVRDSMSLLGQVLALGPGKLTEESTRNVLGLAGQEAFTRVLDAFRDGDSLALTRTLREMLDQGLDMGFFLRELSSLWRNLFILRQSGEAALGAVELPEAEARALLDIARGFSLTHIHASWQMTLEGQRRVLTSLEPALALELLLLNLAMLPELLSLEQLTALGRRSGPAAPPDSTGASGKGSAGTSGMPRPISSSAGTTSFASSPSLSAEKKTDASGSHNAESSAIDTSAATKTEEIPSTSAAAPAPAEPAKVPSPAPRPLPAQTKSERETNGGTPPWEEDSDDDFSEVDIQVALQSGKSDGAHGAPAFAVKESAPAASVCSMPELLGGLIFSADDSNCDAVSPEASSGNSVAGDVDGESIPSPAPGTASFTRPIWADVTAQCATQGAPAWFIPLLSRITGSWKGETLELRPRDVHTAQLIQEDNARPILMEALTILCGKTPPLRVLPPAVVAKTRDELKQEVFDHPFVKMMEQAFDARVLDFGQFR